MLFDFRSTLHPFMVVLQIISDFSRTLWVKPWATTKKGLGSNPGRTKVFYVSLCILVWVSEVIFLRLHVSKSKIIAK
jgi:hypothetical protein